MPGHSSTVRLASARPSALAVERLLAGTQGLDDVELGAGKVARGRGRRLRVEVRLEVGADDVDDVADLGRDLLEGAEGLGGGAGPVVAGGLELALDVDDEGG